MPLDNTICHYGIWRKLTVFAYSHECMPILVTTVEMPSHSHSKRNKCNNRYLQIARSHIKCRFSIRAKRVNTRRILHTIRTIVNETESKVRDRKNREKSGNKNQNQKLLALIVHIFFCRFNDEIMHNDEIRRIDAFKKQPQNRANDCIDDEETDSRTSEVDEWREKDAYGDKRHWARHTHRLCCYCLFRISLVSANALITLILFCR